MKNSAIIILKQKIYRKKHYKGKSQVFAIQLIKVTIFLIRQKCVTVIHIVDENLKVSLTTILCFFFAIFHPKRGIIILQQDFIINNSKFIILFNFA